MLVSIRVLRVGLLLLPFALLLAAGFRYEPDVHVLLWLGALFQGLGCLCLLLHGRGWRDPLGLPGMVLYVIALSWLTLALPNRNDGYLYVARSLLLILPLWFFASQCLIESGARDLRRARLLCERLAKRTEWPEDLAACRSLPEVRELRQVSRLDAGPALGLLSSACPQLRIVALTALRGRRDWQPGQTNMVLEIARQAAEPEVRMAAINSLAEVEDRAIVEGLVPFLADASHRVRRIATEALFSAKEPYWPWIREPLRLAMAHPHGSDDGSLCPNGYHFSQEAVADFIAWSCEKGILALRAALTLGSYAELALAHGREPRLAQKLRERLADAHTAPVLRLEIARVLQRHQELDDKVLQALIDPSTPAPLRLIAVETMLGRGNAPQAEAALHDLARLPNRDIALATAEVVQRRLGVDLGLPRNQPPPAVNTRQAADIARKVQQWSTHSHVGPDEKEPDAAW